MHMKDKTYICEWTSVADPDALGGVASFKVVGQNIAYAVRLCSVRDFQLIQDLLDAAAYEGERRATQNLRAKIMQALAPVPYE